MSDLICSYLRVSTANQRDEQTIETQRYALDSYCELHGIQIDPSFRFEDDGVSGGIEIHKRPRGGELYKLINSGAVNCLLLFHADRIGRDTIDSLLFHRLAETQGTRIIGIADGTDTGREGSVFTTEMRAVVAAEYRRDVVRRTRAGLRRRAAAGKISTNPPFGYLLDDGHLVVDEHKAEIVTRVFAKAARGDRTRDIVQWLNESNAPSPRGKGWRHDTLIYLLKNHAYEGKFVSFGTPRRRPGGGRRIPRDPKEQVIISCPAIVTPEIFEAVQSRLAFNRQWCSTSGKYFYLLKSLIRCGQCGRAYVGHTITGRRYKETKYPNFGYYECGTVSNRDYEFCGNVRVSASRLETAVWDQIERFISSPSQILGRLSTRYNRQAEVGSTTADRKWKRIGELKAKNLEARERLALAVARGILGDDDARRASEVLLREFGELESGLAELGRSRSETEVHRKRLLNAEAVLTALRERLDQGFNPQKKAEITRSLVRQAVVTKTGEGRAQVAVQYVFPCPANFSPGGFPLSASSRKK
jgi:site-specific DNA recombinase